MTPSASLPAHSKFKFSSSKFEGTFFSANFAQTRWPRSASEFARQKQPEALRAVLSCSFRGRFDFSLKTPNLELLKLVFILVFIRAFGHLHWPKTGCRPSVRADLVP
jgi:hypothetical protein